jgi:hypothetical protein
MSHETRKKVGKVIASAWASDDYRNKLRTDPHAALAEHGVDVPKDRKVKVLEDSADTIHIVIPERPTHLSDADLQSEQVHADATKFFC